MVQDIDIKHTIFSRELSEEQIKKILDTAEIKKFAVREVIFSEYEELKSVYLNLEGTVVLGINIANKGRINIGTVHPGGVFAWSSLFYPQLSTASAIAITPVRVLDIPAARLRELMENDPALGYDFMKMIANTISQRLSDTRLQLANAITI